MHIQHNIAALNSHRQLATNTSALSKNLEKLSSGYRINRAGDDAAGLAISEKMRAQIRGLDQATANANDAISLVQTAEGGMQETHSILQRMRELAVQSSNGTYQDTVDREALNKEMSSLKSEIDRIAKSTNFNGISLLDGSLGGTQATAAAGAITNVAGAGAAKITISGGNITAADTLTLSSAAGDLTTLAVTAATTGVTFQASDDHRTFVAVVNQTASLENAEKWNGVVVKIENATVAAGAATSVITPGTASANALKFTISANGTNEGQVALNLENMDANSLQITATSVDTQANAAAAIASIDAAINTVSMQRADLGALQNRLEHTVNNLGTTSENLTSAESRVRDVDMAKEMMAMTKNNILNQASTAMLAQANTMPQSILQLLQ